MASRPPQIQRAIRQYPIGTEVEYRGEIMYLCGWAETSDHDHVRLIFSVVDPFLDYDAAQLPANRRYICEHHLAPVNPDYVE